MAADFLISNSNANNMNNQDDKKLRSCKEKLDKKLLPCPFCGGKAELENTWTAHYWVECKGCGAQMSDMALNRNADDLADHKASMNDASHAWNKRIK